MIPEKALKVLKILRVPEPILLGSGAEGYIFSYRSDSVVKIFNNTTLDYLQSLAVLLRIIAKANLSYFTPEIQEIGNIEGNFYTIEKKLVGVSMEQKFPLLGTKDKYKLLKSYYEAVKEFKKIILPDAQYGNILRKDTAINCQTWQEFLVKKAKQRIERAGKKLSQDVPSINEHFRQFAKIVKKELVIDKKSFVHSDYFINQVLVNEKNEISAVLDISYHAVAGDKRLDIASVVFFYGIQDYLPEYINHLLKLEVADYGDSIIRYNNIYKLYFCFYFSNIYLYIPAFYDAIIRHLNSKALWVDLL